MSRRRRAALLLGLSLVLGALAASDVSRREAALRAELGPPVDVLVAARPLRAERRLGPGDLAVRRVPARYAGEATGPAVPELLLGRRLAVPVPAGARVAGHLLATEGAAGPAIREGERAAEVLARASPELVVPGARVDVLVTRERGDGGPGATELALEDVEVLAAAPAAAPDDAAPHVSATLRVTVEQAVYLAAAGAFAREVRLLARAPGDRSRTGTTVTADDLG